MRIFYLITKSEAGGAQTHIWQLSKYLIKKGNKVALMSFPGGWLKKEVKKIGGKFYPNYFLSNTFNLFKLWKASRIIKRALKDFQPDLVSCHSTVAGFLGRLVIKNKIPTIFTAHGWGFTEGTPWWRKIILIFLEKWVSKYSQKIICVSEFDKKLALKYRIASSSKLITIYNGVEIKSFSQKKIFRFPLKIIFVGRLTKQKDPLLLLRAFKELPLKLKNKSEILIIGEGEKKEKLKKFIKENNLFEKVKLLGEIPREKVLELLKNSDIFVLTSYWEGGPISILEAMSFKLPVIASEVGGVKEIVNKKCGILIRPGDKEGLKLALRKFFQNPNLLLKKGEAGFQKVKKEFSLKKMLKETFKAYQNLLS